MNIYKYPRDVNSYLKRKVVIMLILKDVNVIVLCTQDKNVISIGREKGMINIVHKSKASIAYLSKEVIS